MAYIHDDTDSSKTLTVAHVPTWISSGDPIIQRGQRTVVMSMTQTEARWRTWGWWVIVWLRKLRDLA